MTKVSRTTYVRYLLANFELEFTINFHGHTNRLTFRFAPFSWGLYWIAFGDQTLCRSLDVGPFTIELNWARAAFMDSPWAPK